MTYINANQYLQGPVTRNLGGKSRSVIFGESSPCSDLCLATIGDLPNAHHIDHVVL